MASPFITGLCLLLLAQALATALLHVVPLPLPAPVLGLLMLWPALRWAPLRRAVAAAAQPLLAHLSLLFVPAAVGALAYLTLLSQHLGALLLVIVLSSAVGIALSAWLLRDLSVDEAQAPGQADD